MADKDNWLNFAIEQIGEALENTLLGDGGKSVHVLSMTREIGSQDAVTCLLHERDNFLPAPSPMPISVNQDIGTHACSFLALSQMNANNICMLHTYINILRPMLSSGT